MDVLFGTAEFFLDDCGRSTPVCSGIFFCHNFQTCINRKNYPETFYIKFSKTALCWAQNALQTWKIIAASDFEQQNTRDVTISQFLLAFSAQQYVKF